MKTFPQEPSVSKAPASEQKWWRPTLWVLNDTYVITFLDGEQLVIPANFPFSASVPRIFWPLIGPTGTIFIAGLVHDWLYNFNPFKWTRKLCDYVFWEIAERVKHRKYAHWVAHLGVRIGGKKAWDGHRKANNTDIINGRQINEQ